jgi:Transposase and inactivated derivatives, IS30 family
MNYKQLDEKKKAVIETLISANYTMRAIGRMLKISHSTVSRYKNKVYQKRVIEIKEKYKEFIEYLYKHYDWRCRSIEVCVHEFRRYHPRKQSVSAKQVYNWINTGKIDIGVEATCYKRRTRKKAKANGMMKHLEWNMSNKTVLPIRLRPKYIDERKEIGHLEIDSIIGRKNEYSSIISIVDRASRVFWLIKAEGKNEYYIDKLIRQYIKEKEITVKSITTDNGLEFKALGITAKRLGVKYYKCDPYCSFQRGTNEKTNGLVRRYIPKGKSMYEVEQQYLDDIAFKLNSMPRKMFDFKTPFNVEFNLLKSGAVEIT